MGLCGAEADIALVTEVRYERPQRVDWYVRHILEEDELVAAALQRHGLSSVRVDWARPEVDWASFAAVVLRTTWNYTERFAEFSQWLTRVAAATRLINSPAVLAWNMDKHYLADLETRGVHSVPTCFVDSMAGGGLVELCAERGWSEVVVKPTCGAAARDTYRIDLTASAVPSARFAELVATQAMMIQPFQRAIVDRGEMTLMVFGGNYTHAVIKVARAGDFRVQDDYGGSVHDYQPDAEEIAFAELAVAACAETPTYGRVDMVRDNAGELAVMELELVEPELWMRRHPPAAERFAARLYELVSAAASSP